MKKMFLLFSVLLAFILSGCGSGQPTKKPDDAAPAVTQILEPDPIERSAPDAKTVGVLYLDFYGETHPPLKQVYVEDHTKITIDDIDSDGFSGWGVGMMIAEDESVAPVCTSVLTFETNWIVIGIFEPSDCTIKIKADGVWTEGEQCVTCEVAGTICEPWPDQSWDFEAIEMEYLYESETFYVTQNKVDWEYTFEFESFSEELMSKEFIANCALFYEEGQP